MPKCFYNTELPVPALACIRQAQPEWAGLLQRIPVSELNEVVTDLPAVYQDVVHYIEQTGFFKKKRYGFMKIRCFPCTKLYRFEKTLEDGLQEKVWLKSGGFLVIQQTEAFIAIDVNSGNVRRKRTRKRYIGRLIWKQLMKLLISFACVNYLVLY